MNNNDNRNRQKKKNSPLAIAFAVLLAFFSIAESAGGDADVFIGIIVIIAIIFAVFFVVGKLSKNVREKGGAAVKDSIITRFSRDSGETPPVTASRPKTFIYDDRAYERNEQRDIQRRLSQLDEFLKNGIIEKEEYRILRARYERNGK